MTELPALRVPQWDAVPGLAHAFLGRRGGVSLGPFASLNLALRSADDPVKVRENRRRVEATFAAGAQLIYMKQVHGDHVARVDSLVADVGAADAMVSEHTGALLGILTADCVPILVLARRRHVVAAVHAGWRGTVDGIIVQAVARLRADFDVGPDELEAALGPAIGGECYEVERIVGEQFVARWGALPEPAWRGRGAKGMFDLRQANRHLLRTAGVPEARIYDVGPCTRCAPADYFSHRGSGGLAGRQLSYIGWTI